MLELLDDLAPEYDSEKEEEWALFIQNNANYYIPVFDKFDRTGEHANFNLAAAFLGFYWATYRKMYLVGVFQAVLVLFLSNLLGGFIYVASFFIYGFFGDWFYYKHCIRKIGDIKQAQLSQGARNARMKSLGGVSLMVPIGIVVGLIAFLGLIVLLFSRAF